MWETSVTVILSPLINLLLLLLFSYYTYKIICIYTLNIKRQWYLGPGSRVGHLFYLAVTMRLKMLGNTSNVMCIADRKSKLRARTPLGPVPSLFYHLRAQAESSWGYRSIAILSMVLVHHRKLVRIIKVDLIRVLHNTWLNLLLHLSCSLATEWHVLYFAALNYTPLLYTTKLYNQTTNPQLKVIFLILSAFFPIEPPS